MTGEDFGDSLLSKVAATFNKLIINIRGKLLYSEENEQQQEEEWFVIK